MSSSSSAEEPSTAGDQQQEDYSLVDLDQGQEPKEKEAETSSFMTYRGFPQKIGITQLKELAIIPDILITATVRDALKADPTNAYTVQGILIQCFGVSEDNAVASTSRKQSPAIVFSGRKTTVRALDTKVRRALHLLRRRGEVDRMAADKVPYYFWKTAVASSASASVEEATTAS